MLYVRLSGYCFVQMKMLFFCGVDDYCVVSFFIGSYIISFYILCIKCIQYNESLFAFSFGYKFCMFNYIQRLLINEILIYYFYHTYIRNISTKVRSKVEGNHGSYHGNVCVAHRSIQIRFRFRTHGPVALRLFFVILLIVPNPTNQNQFQLVLFDGFIAPVTVALVRCCCSCIYFFFKKVVLEVGNCCVNS